MLINTAVSTATLRHFGGRGAMPKVTDQREGLDLMPLINDSSGGMAPYRQLAGILRAAIQAGDLPIGAQVPSARELSDTYGVARNTAVKAVEELRREGLIETARGRGSFVTSQPALIRQPEQRYLRTNTQMPGTQLTARTGTTTATADLATRLMVEIGDDLSVVHYAWTTTRDGQPLQQSTQWEPLALTAGTPIEVPDTTGNTTVIMRFASIGLRLTHITEEKRSRLPTAAETVSLAIPAGATVQEVHRTHWRDELPVETANIIIRGDRVVIADRYEIPD